MAAWTEPTPGSSRRGLHGVSHAKGLKVQNASKSNIIQTMASQFEKILPDSFEVIRQSLDEGVCAKFVARLGQIVASLERSFNWLERRNSDRGWLAHLKRAHSRYRVVRIHTHAVANLIETYGAGPVIVRQYTNYIYDPHFAEGASRLVPDLLCRLGNVTEAELVRVMLNRSRGQMVRRLGNVPR